MPHVADSNQGYDDETAAHHMGQCDAPGEIKLEHADEMGFQGKPNWVHRPVENYLGCKRSVCKGAVLPWKVEHDVDMPETRLDPQKHKYVMSGTVSRLHTYETNLMQLQAQSLNIGIEGVPQAWLEPGSPTLRVHLCSKLWTCWA